MICSLPFHRARTWVCPSGHKRRLTRGGEKCQKDGTTLLKMGRKNQFSAEEWDIGWRRRGERWVCEDGVETCVKRWMETNM